MKPLSEQGIWWLAETPDITEVGTLTFDQMEGARLNIVGQLATSKYHLGNANSERGVIHGITTAGKPVTLLDAYVIGTRINFPGITTETWRTNMVAVGAHFTSVDEELFNRSWVRFDGIAQWLAHQPFAETFDFETNETKLAVRKPASELLGVISGTKVYTGSHISWGREGHERWTSASKAMIAIDSDKLKSLNWHFSAASKLRSLVELLYGRSLHLTDLKIELPREPKEAGGPPYDEIEIHAHLIGGDENLAPVDRRPMLSAPALLEAAPNALDHWFAQYETLSAALHLLSTVASDRRMFINVRFLLAAQAIETLHREAFPDTLVPDVEHAVIVRALTAAIPAQTSKAMREKLISSLKFSNEPSLRNRLRSLIVWARDGRTNVMPGYDRAFVNAVVDTRNHETHHGERPGNCLTGAEMHWAIRRLVVLITVLFLRRLGLAPDKIDHILESHNEFSVLWKTTGTP